MSFGKRLKKVRLLRKLTQSELGLKIGKSKATISIWETVDKTIKNEEVLKIAKALNTTYSYLMGESIIINDGEESTPEEAITLITNEIYKINEINNILLEKILSEIRGEV